MEKEVTMSKYAMKQKRLAEEALAEKQERLLGVTEQEEVGIDEEVKRQIDEVKTLHGLEVQRGQKEEKLVRTMLNAKLVKANLDTLTHKAEMLKVKIEEAKRGLQANEERCEKLRQTIEYINKRISTF